MLENSDLEYEKRQEILYKILKAQMSIHKKELDIISREKR
jgi:hypothetical protein